MDEQTEQELMDAYRGWTMSAPFGAVGVFLWLAMLWNGTVNLVGGLLGTAGVGFALFWVIRMVRAKRRAGL